ncbi:hypothetical protein NNX28_09000 [Arthrobacter sp. zg-Y859]|uniref:Polyketide cyclase / dehydrase and lipid transport n=1 Tax=Arthrobacter jinronghuae TaxID=2964609 RepID=A0ABT1NQQ8_9MICC|nr:hypothetical protein [Arthrobacter jinronghuae]MCQ1950063.1 hypothetical protein [Arthrobacter jinronghuae]UWX80203.1 hypothetical protein N2K98_08490 [Arthrobacter jinronghuae]
MPGLYILPSSWLLNATPEAVWETVASPEMSWPRWWPGCTLQDLATDPGADTADPTSQLLATTVRLRFRAALGYDLSITIQPTAAVRPRIIEFDAGGDLAGTGRIRLFPIAAATPGNAPDDAAQTRMDIDWRVRPTRRWMRLLTPVARPAFAAAHSLLMRQGERGLRRELAQATRRGLPNKVRTPGE